MIDDRQEELASLHAFGLLEGEERAQFVAEMAANPELARRVAELAAVATGLAHAAPEATPPDALKARILASAARADQELEGDEEISSGRPRGKVVLFPAWVPWLAAAAIGLAALWSERQYNAAKAENLHLAQQNLLAVTALNQAQARLQEQRAFAVRNLEQAQAELAQAKQLVTETSRRVAELATRLKDEGDLAKYKISTLASMLGNSPAAVAVAVWDPAREQGVLSVSKLPVAASEKDYQLWVIDKAYAAPVSAGTFVVDPATGEAHIVFRADKPVNAIAKFAVSLERKGGSPSPQGPIVMISQ
jgi:anti-sigma-K factor RskA